MKWLFKWCFRLLLFLLISAGVIVLLRNVIAQQLLERRITEWTGHDALIGRIEIELSRPWVHIEKLRLYQPRELEARAALEATEIHVAYDPHALLKFGVHLHTLDVRLKDVLFVRKERHSTQQILTERFRRGAASQRTPFSPLRFEGIDTLSLSLDTFKHLDYVQMARSQDVLVNVKNRTVTNLQSGANLEAFLRALAEEKGVRWPVVPEPEPSPASPGPGA